MSYFVDWIHVTQDKNAYGALVNKEMNFQDP
jgi:hypothetical protein